MPVRTEHLRHVVAIVAILLSSSCVTTPNSPRTPIEPEEITWKFPPSDQPVSRQIGETLIENGWGLRWKSISFTRSSKIAVDAHLGSDKLIVVSPGTQFLRTDNINGREAYCGVARWHNWFPGGPLLKDMCLVNSNGRFLVPGDKAAGGSSDAVYTYDLKFEKTTKYVDGSDSFKVELLYTGKSANDVFLSYREFKNNLARPAFTQNLRYDVSSDKVIGFRKLRLEVLEATNTNIRYRLLSPLTSER